jgi:cellulose synthase/poly-beta-1,6-N-acetylglucosamine synthase-like glycosyltransferase
MIFLLCAGAALYVIAGYPLLLALLARWRSRPVASARSDRTVSVLLPVHNGEPWLKRKLENILALDYPRELLEVLVVSDGSTDRTEQIAARFPVQLHRIPRSGKAAALNCALEHARGEILFFTDVRQRLDPEALRRLVDCFADPQVGAATGELIIQDGRTQEEANVGLYWKYEKWIRKRLSRVDSVLGATGCIWAMRREFARPMPPGTLLDDMHLPLQAFFAGLRIVMEDRARAYDLPTGLETEFRRKVRTQAGVYQLIGQYPALLAPGTRMWWHFVSYKLGRLMLPFLAIGTAVGAALLPDPWRGAALAPQAGLYLLAALNRWVPLRARLKGASAAASAFVVLLAAALCAVSILFVPPGRLWSDARARAGGGEGVDTSVDPAR